MELNYQIKFWNWTKTYQFLTKYKMIFKIWHSTATLTNKNPWLTLRSHHFKTDWTTTSRNPWQTNCPVNGTSTVKTHLAVSKDSRALFEREKEWKEVAKISQKMEKVPAAKILVRYLWNHLPLTLFNSLRTLTIRLMTTIWVKTLPLYQCN